MCVYISWYSKFFCLYVKSIGEAAVGISNSVTTDKKESDCVATGEIFPGHNIENSETFTSQNVAGAEPFELSNVTAQEKDHNNFVASTTVQENNDEIGASAALSDRDHDIIAAKTASQGKIGVLSNTVDGKILASDDSGKIPISSHNLLSENINEDAITYRDVVDLKVKYDETNEILDLVYQNTNEIEEKVSAENMRDEEMTKQDTSETVMQVYNDVRRATLSEDSEIGTNEFHPESASTAPPIENKDSAVHQLTDDLHAQLTKTTNMDTLYPTLQAIKVTGNL